MDSNQINGQMQNDPNSNNIEGSQSAYEAAYGASQYSQPQHAQPSQPPVAGTEVFQSQPSGYQSQQQTQQQTQQPTQPQGQYQQYAAQPSYQAAPQPSTQAAPQSIPGSAPQTTSQVVPPVIVNPSQQKRSGAKTFLLAFAGAAVACVVAFGLFMGFRPFGSGNGVNVTLGGSGSSVEAVEAEASLAEAVANKCLPSVVSINTYSTGSSGSSNPLYDYFYGGSQDSGEEIMSGLGSGIIISNDGYILTNYHVIANATRFEVNIEGDIHEATLVGQDASSDIAVLKVDDATDLTPIEIADGQQELTLALMTL